MFTEYFSINPTVALKLTIFKQKKKCCIFSYAILPERGGLQRTGEGTVQLGASGNFFLDHYTSALLLALKQNLI